MRKELIVSTSVLVEASAEKIWHALTSPEKIKEYLFGAETITDWQPGSDIVFKGEYQGRFYQDHGKILDIEPNEKISYSYWTEFSGLSDVPENYSTVTYLIKPIAPHLAEFTWIQSGFADEGGYNHSKATMGGFLNEVKRVMEEA